MSKHGPKKYKTKTVVATTPAMPSIALYTSSHLANSVTPLFAAVTSAVIKFASAVTDTFTYMRGKKRNAEEALQAAPSAEEDTFDAALSAAIAAAEANKNAANAAENLALVPSPINSDKIHAASTPADKPRHIQLNALNSLEGQRLFEGREALRAAGKTSGFKRTDGEEPLKRFHARRKKTTRK